MDENKKTSKIGKKIGIGALIATPFVAAILAPIGVGLYLTSPTRKKTEEKPSDYEMDFEEVTFQSKIDQTVLKGWWIPSNVPSKKVIITAHGYTNERSQGNIKALKLIKEIHDEGYNIFMFDFRKFGESEGKRTGVGYYEQHDLHSAIDYVLIEKNQEGVALMGWSMGAATSLISGSEHDKVSVIIADSPFSELRDYLDDNLSVWSKLPKKPFTPMILYSLEKFLKINPKEVSPLSSVKNGKNTAYFIIHSKDDQKIPYQNSVAIFKNIKNESYKELWLSEGSKHIATYVDNEKEYQKRVIDFLKKYL